ncbi:MAG: FAD-dependent oxidoreductase, partial [Cellulomonas sp.]|nr:FAD-dependent oxidoreductase [Cellulomonas sp.]
MSTRAVVVGAGVGGLSAAIHLARQGLDVTVVEKNGAPGGRLGQFTREGHRVSTGPTLLIMPLLYRSELAHLGADLDRDLAPVRVDPTYDMVFDDGTRLAMTSDLEAMRRQLEAIEPGSFGGLLRYLEEGRRH